MLVALYQVIAFSRKHRVYFHAIPCSRLSYMSTYILFINYYLYIIALSRYYNDRVEVRCFSKQWLWVQVINRYNNDRARHVMNT